MDWRCLIVEGKLPRPRAARARGTRARCPSKASANGGREPGGSEYLWTRHRPWPGRWQPPRTSTPSVAVQRAVAPRWRRGWSRTAHDCSEGGVAVALAESRVTAASPVGAMRRCRRGDAGDLTLDFGEGPSRVLVAVEARHARRVRRVDAESGDPWALDRDDKGGNRLVNRVGRHGRGRDASRLETHGGWI